MCNKAFVSNSSSIFSPMFFSASLPQYVYDFSFFDKLYHQGASLFLSFFSKLISILLLQDDTYLEHSLLLFLQPL